MSTVIEIISGGQTGADRGGLEAAIDLGLKRGGWAPKGWRAEDGRVPAMHRLYMRESGSTAYPVRTEQNVRDSDGTLLLSFGALAIEGGSMLTANLARKLGKPNIHIIIPLDGGITGVALDRAREWIHERNIRVLNVAGPRESVERGLQSAVRRALGIILT